MTFANLGLSEPILKAIGRQGYKQPSPIQAKAVPEVLKGFDLMAASETGSGKTAGFVWPLLETLAQGPRPKSNHARSLILTPTRELAMQVFEKVRIYSENLKLSSTAVYGGVNINPQMMKLRRGCDVLIATPGRLLDLHRQNAVRFNQLEIFVLDEADRMLDMGFIGDIRSILGLMPKNRQSLMFSATFSDAVRKLAKGLVKDPVEISVNKPNTTAKSVEQWVYPVDKKRKPDLLTHLIEDNAWQQVLVFTRTKHGADRLTRHLSTAGLRACAIHGDKRQGQRARALEQFKNGRTRVLVATDVAARGLDIVSLPHVVNFDLPDAAEDYIHRIGRTGRAGNKGQAVSLVSADESKQLSSIERLIKQLLARKQVEGFEPEHKLPKAGQKPARKQGGFKGGFKDAKKDKNWRSKKTTGKGKPGAANGKRKKFNNPKSKARKSAPPR